MGASGSKASRAAGSAARQYPKGPKGPRPPPSTTTTTAPAPSQTTNAPPQPPPAQDHAAGPTVRPQPRAAHARSEAINLDASDPDFARSLRSLGPVQPNPTLSPSSAFGQRDAGAPPDPRKNPAIAVLEARAELQRRAEAEQEARAKQGRGFVGKEFLDVFDLRQVVFERDVKGRGEGEIERRLGLKEGVVRKLGGEGVLGLAREQGREKGAVDVV